MGVLKNGVGRPSNETIKKRNILKVVCFILVVIILLLVAYIVNDKLGNKDTNSTNKNTTTQKTEIKSNYDNFDFVNSTEAEVYLSDDNLKFIYAKVIIKNGKIIVENEKGEEFVDDSIANPKCVATFNNAIHNPEASLAILTTDGYLYTALSINNNKINFRKIDYNKKIKELYVIDEYDQRMYSENMLYVLNSDNKLLNVKYDGFSDSNYIINGDFEERIVYIGGTDAVYYSGELDVKSDVLKLYVKDSLEIVKFNGKNVKVKYLFKNYDDNGTEGIFIVTADDEIITTEKRGDFIQHNDENYKFVLHKNLKIKDIIEVSSNYSSSIKVVYEDDSFEIFDNVSQTYNVSTKK